MSGGADGRIKVHNGDLYLECLQCADWTPSDNCSSPTETMKRLHQARHELASQHSPGRQRAPPGSPKKLQKAVLPVTQIHSQRKLEEELAAVERTLRQREAFLEKQRTREVQTRERLERSMYDTQKRAKERALQREKDFEERCASFCDTNTHLVEHVTDVLDDERKVQQRKKERLYATWNQQVFEPAQRDIDRQLATMTHEDIAEKRRYMYQCYLDEANRKKGGVFRDIIMEADYDPLTMRKEATLTYPKISLAVDPTKNRSMRETAAAEMSTGIVVGSVGSLKRSTLLAGTSSSASASGGSRPTALLSSQQPTQREQSLPVAMWNRIEVTPYGRYQSSAEGPEPIRKPNFNKSSVVTDHYHVPTGAAGSEILKKEHDLRGKRVFEKPASNVF